MSKHSISLHPLDALRLVSILKTAKPRRKALREVVSPLQENLLASLQAEDPKQLIREAVIEAILRIAGESPPVSDAQPLSGLGYTPPMYAQLAAEMTTIVRAFKPSAVILPSEVIKAQTVGGCVALAIKKAGV